jgi:hypothetical protein
MEATGREHQTPLPADVIKHMMSFLAPRDLLNISVTSKCFRSIIDEEVVLKVGLFSGGNSKQSMINLISMLRDQTIFIPDAMRMLRVVCGVVCERCCVRKVKVLRPKYGVFICWSCMRCHKFHTDGKLHSVGPSCVEYDRLTRAWRKSNKTYLLCPRLYDTIFEHPRTCAYSYGRTPWKRYDGKDMGVAYGKLQYMWSRHEHERITNTKIGPIVTYPDVKSLAQEFLIFEGLLNDCDDSGVNAVNLNVDNSFRKDRKNVVSEVIGEMLILNLRAPHPSSYKEIISAYDACQEEVEKMHSAKIQRMKRTRMHNQEKKLKKVEAMLEKLSSEVGGSLGQRVLEYVVNVNEYSIRYTNVPCVQWNYLDVFALNTMLEQYVQYPNRMTDDKLITLASRVRNRLSYYSDNHRMQTHNGVNMFVVKRKRFVRLYGPGHLLDESFW